MYSMQVNSKSDLAIKFEQFHQHIDFPPERYNNIIAAYKPLSDKVLTGFPYVDKTCLAGAFARKTLLKTAKNVDVFVYVDQQFADLTPSSVLNKLHKDLVFSHPYCVINPSKTSVVVINNLCSFQLTPVVWAKQQFNLPASGGKNWLEVPDETVLQQKLADANQQSNNKIIPLIKMIKVWLYKHRVTTAKSFEIEQQVIDCLGDFDTFREGLEKLLTFYCWRDQIYSSYQIERMDNYQFALYCRNTLFGGDFPA